jgi:uncharacterized protein
METKIFKIISTRLNIPESVVQATIKLLDDGATIPFIARYRKEVTGSLDEVAILAISNEINAMRELMKRKEYILATIKEADKLTDDLASKIEECYDANILEDIYAPFKPRKRTRAQIAREKGFEPLAAMIMSQRVEDVDKAASRFGEGAVEGAVDIIAEWVSDNARARNMVRNSYRRTGVISSSIIKGKEADAAKYLNYDGFSKPLKYVSSHAYLAMRRAEREGLLKVTEAIDNDEMVDKLCDVFVKREATPQTAELVEQAVADGYKRLLKSSIENEVSVEVKERADKEAINLFADNLKQLLLAAPLGSKRVLAIDPGYRTGCKIVCLDQQGNLRYNDVIYPVPPKNDIKGAARKLSTLVEQYKIDAIALGNGTASRETEHFLQNMRFPHAVQVFVVDESGASIYSASAVARAEFPDKDVTVRGAVSIGRRLLDPLAELVKIDPKSIGVGQYQHDVDQTALKQSLDYTVESCVNSVGVNLNTASRELLSYVSGIGQSLAQKIVEYRAENGDFKSRKELKKVPRLGDKAFEQCAGFLRIPGGDNPLDNTAVHPESYKIVERMAADLGCDVEHLLANKELINSIDLNRYVTPQCGLPTLKDIIEELEKPGRDPRTVAKVLVFDSTLKTIEDVKVGMILPGIVNNITAFGAFVDVGVKESGLVHISQMSDKRISSPSEVLKLHQHVRVKVLDVDLARKRISLTMKGL